LNKKSILPISEPTLLEHGEMHGSGELDRAIIRHCDARRSRALESNADEARGFAVPETSPEIRARCLRDSERREILPP
jgi:hypothetical protein